MVPDDDCQTHSQRIFLATESFSGKSPNEFSKPEANQLREERREYPPGRSGETRPRDLSGDNGGIRTRRGQVMTGGDNPLTVRRGREIAGRPGVRKGDTNTHTHTHKRGQAKNDRPDFTLPIIIHL